jgi:hypothetical protein
MINIIRGGKISVLRKQGFWKKEGTLKITLPSSAIEHRVVWWNFIDF